MTKRVAIIDKAKCHSDRCQKWCLSVCPVNRSEKECIILNPNKKAQIDEELCIGCGICFRCPFEAIKVVNLPEKLTESPIHRYGKNEFELFRLPIPKINTVVGILGRNGIGKTTALNILANQIKPNLGKYENPPEKEEIIEKYSTVSLGDYFKRLYKNKVKISYKPQRIELLPKYYKGKVLDLIKKIDETKQGEELIETLNLHHLKERNLKDLSGGELQKVAIIAAMIKKAEVYYFDEPASFLDVTSRMQVSRIIRSLAKDKSVMVVEHDLTLLDYISDEIQVIYGQPACYGIISQSKAVRRGINEYMDGFLPDDNVRFRDYAIKFSTIPIKRETLKEPLYQFPELEKSYENFHLKVNEGTIEKGQVLAVMGANGLGKTTFLKLLTGIEKPDSGKLEKVKIAYKPQYPSSDIQGTVIEHLQKIAGSQFNSGWYKQDILEKLNIKPILNNQIKTLSGGELQKTYIAATLSTDAKILAFDEPSAFVDVEDRLKVAEVIKDFVLKKETSAIVVDHDVQFVDYLADSMLVFEGTPAVKGEVYGPCEKREGMNRVLKMLNITYRRDKETQRPRINKEDSQLDEQQKKKGEYYYA